MWIAAKQAAKEGRLDDIPASLYIPYKRTFDAIWKEEKNKVKPMTNFIPRPWQNYILRQLEQPPHPRNIYWYWEETGGVGKTTLANYLLRNLGAVVLSSGKSNDIAYLLDSPKIVLFDLSRSQEDHVNYGIMEDIKNGRVFSPKYESMVKVFDIPHLLVFANFPCPHGKFSSDRIKLTNLGEEEDEDAPTTPIRDYVSSYVDGFVPPQDNSLFDNRDFE